MFGNSSKYITEEQLQEALEPIFKRLRALEVANRSLKKALAEAESRALPQKPKAEDAEASGYFAPLEAEGQPQPEAIAQPAEAAQPAAAPAQPEPKAQPELEAPASEELYLAVPTPEGVFTEATREEVIGKSIYRLVTDNGRQGRFTLIDSPDAMATAMLSVSQFIKPACRIEGNTHHRPESIETIEEGEAENIDGHWTVTSKATVRFR